MLLVNIDDGQCPKCLSLLFVDTFKKHTYKFQRAEILLATSGSFHLTRFNGGVEK
jgi:hypothetical protein